MKYLCEHGFIFTGPSSSKFTGAFWNAEMERTTLCRKRRGEGGGGGGVGYLTTDLLSCICCLSVCFGRNTSRHVSHLCSGRWGISSLSDNCLLNNNTHDFSPLQKNAREMQQQRKKKRRPCTPPLPLHISISTSTTPSAAPYAPPPSPSS